MPRTGPFTDEHKQRISEALRRYNQDGGHLAEYRKAGEQHPNWKGGVDPKAYRRIAFDTYGRTCSRCGSGDDIHVHHIDGNRGNSQPANLEVLCRSCHMLEHHGKRVDWACPKCGQWMRLRPFEARTRKFCSKTCRWGVAA